MGAFTREAKAQLEQAKAAHDSLVAEIVQSMRARAEDSNEASNASEAYALAQERAVQAAEDLDKAQAALETFRRFNVRSFEHLRNRVSLKPQLELVVHSAT